LDMCSIIIWPNMAPTERGLYRPKNV